MALSSAAAVRRALIFDGHEKLAWWAGGGEQAAEQLVKGQREVGTSGGVE